MKQVMAEENENEIDLDNALKYFVDFKETPDYTYFEHTYSQPSHKKYYNGFSNPAKFLFTNPVPNMADSSTNSEFVDIETLDHDAPLFFNSEKINEQVNDKSEGTVYDENWADKIDRKEWNIIKLRLFKSVVQILEADYLSRLAYKGLRDEAVKRYLMIKKTASRLRSLFGSVAWDPHSCQWLHSLLLEKLPSCYMKVYSDAFQRLESKVPSHFLEHMTISTSYMSVRSRLLGEASQNNASKKSWDIFSPSLAQNKPKKIIGEPLLVVIPSNMGNQFTSNSRPSRFIAELSSLGTLVTINVAKSPGSTEIPTLLEQIIQATVTKIVELQTEHPNKPIVLIGFGAESLLACHIALGFVQKISAVVCVGFHLFTMEGKVGKANNKILGLKTPVLFVVGQNASTVTIDEMEDFRLRLRCKSGLIVVGGADDRLRVNHFLKIKCSVTQNIVDRCIINEISDFLNDIMQPTKVLLSLLSNNDAVSVQGKPAVSPVDAQLLKTLLSESVNKPDSPIIQRLTKTLAQLQSEQEYGSATNEQSASANKPTESPTPNTRPKKEPNNENETRKKPFSSSDEPMTLKKVLTSNDTTIYRYTHLGQRSDDKKNLPLSQNRLSGVINSNKLTGDSKLSIHTTLAPVNFARKTRGGRRPYVRRTIPPQRKMVVVPSFVPINPLENLDISTSAVIENLTPDSLLHMPVVFADENDEENVINDVSLTSYQP